MYDTDSISKWPGRRLKAIALAAIALAFAPWPASAPAQSPACAESDFNCDGSPDFLWRNYGTDSPGINGVWFMNGVTYLSYADLPTDSDLNWRIGGSGDFNADGRPDIVWRNGATGENRVWYMNGITRIGTANFPAETDLGWKIVGVAKFNADATPDIVWRNGATGENRVWYLNGTALSATAALPSESDSTWRIEGVADFNNDSKPDLLWQKSPGDLRVWYLDGTILTDSPSLPNVPDTRWRVSAARDIDRDGKAEVIWRNGSSGENAVWFVNYNTVEATPNLPVAKFYTGTAPSSAPRSARASTRAVLAAGSSSYTPLNRSATYGLADNPETQGSNMMWLMD